MGVSDDQINSIVERVIEKLGKREPGVSTPLTSKTTISKPFEVPKREVVENLLGCYQNVEDAINASEKACAEYKSVAVRTRVKMIEAIRNICRTHVKDLARMAVEETKMGRYDDKITKNLLAINKTPGVEDLQPTAFTGDDGLTLLERAPFGVIGSITPSTNPTETIICNAIGMIAGGNAVVFNTHPSAKKVSNFTVNG